MITEFKYCTSVDIPQMRELIDGMYEVLEALDEGAIPDRNSYTYDMLGTYLSSLVQNQRGSLGRTKPGSWGVVPNDDGMDADARVDFIFRPTYVASATLSRFLCEYPLLALTLPNYSAALQSGLLFCSHRKLKGHGYESDEGAIDALRILSLGRIPWLLARHPDFCPPLKQAIDDVARDMESRLAMNDTKGPWGEDYADKFRSAIETLRLKNDPLFMRSLEDARKDGTTYSKEGLSW